MKTVSNTEKIAMIQEIQKHYKQDFSDPQFLSRQDNRQL